MRHTSLALWASLWASLCAFVTGCDDEPDAGVDAALPDAGPVDAAGLDAALVDAALVDGALADGALPDGGLDLGPDPLESADRLTLARDRYLAAATTLDPGDGYPKWVDGEGWVASEQSVWTSGFFGGVLWLLYVDAPDEALREAARRWTSRLRGQAFNRLNHDVGFKIMPTFGAAARLFGEAADLDLVATGADALASRFDPVVGCTRSWNHGEWVFPVIIDNMMNLEILLYAAEQGHADAATWRAIAVAHADRTAEEHLRPDGTSFHVVDYDPETGAVLSRGTHQGAADASTWARGQAWALYGFVMVHRFTGEARHLDAARRAADAYLDRLGDEAVPYWDFDAPGIPDAPRDASAAAVAASGLLELSVAADEPRYHAEAVRMLAALGAPPYLAEEGPSILRQSVGHFPEGSEVSVPLVYADYYYVEALLRYRALRRGDALGW